jgi:branched-chain amino acid transport system permease protein
VTDVVEDWIAIGIRVILVLSVNMISGYARQLSLGQAAFAGIGAYTSALLVVRWQMSFWLACPLSVLLCAMVGAILGLPALRAVRHYVTAMTFVLNVFVFYLLGMGRLVGEPLGVGRIPAPQLFDTALTARGYGALVAGAVVCCLLADRSFRFSALGKAWDGIAHDQGTQGLEQRHVAVYIALVISGGMAGLSGSLFAHFATFISPFDFDVETSLFVLAIAALGGLGFLPGVLVSSVGIGWVFEHFQDLTAYRFWFTGIVFLLASLGWPWLHQRRLRCTQHQRQDAEAKE